MAWNEPGNKDPWGRNKNNSNLDGVFKEFKKTIDDLLGSNNTVPHIPKEKVRVSYQPSYWQYIFYLEFIVNDGEESVVLQFGGFNEVYAGPHWIPRVCSVRRDCRCSKN